MFQPTVESLHALDTDVFNMLKALSIYFGVNGEIKKDGAFDNVRYSNATIRILWVLRCRKSNCYPFPARDTAPHITPLTMAMIAYSVFNGLPSYGGLTRAHSRKDILATGMDVACIFIDKHPALTDARKDGPNSDFSLYEYLLRQQITGLVPHIIIGDDTLRLLFPGEVSPDGVVACKSKNGQILVDAGHRAHGGKNNAGYHDRIIALIKAASI